MPKFQIFSKKINHNGQNFQAFTQILIDVSKYSTKSEAEIRGVL